MAQNHQTPNHQTPNQQPEPMEQSDNISQNEKIRKDQVENSAKGMVWLVDDINRLRRFLVLGSEIPTYYTGQRELGIENAKAIVRLFEAGRGVEVVSEILTFSLEGRTAKQNSIMLALAMCARLGDLPTKRKAYEVMPQICRIPTHLFMFVDLSKKLSKPTTGWGRAPRKAIQKWYIEKAPMKLAMALTKYQKREGWSHADVARVTHLKSDNPAIQCVLKYAVRGFAEMSTAFPDSVQNSEELNSVLNFFKAVEEMKKLTKDDADRVVELIEGQQLVREHIPTVCLGSKKVWDALLKKMPMTAMIRNLNKMTAIGLLEENNEQVQLVCENLRNEDLLKKARIHPFNVLLALKQYESGRGDKGSLTWKAIPIITKALEDAFYLSFKNVEPTGKRHMLAMDVSGSMQCGGCVGSPSIQPHVASAAMAMVTARTEDDHIFVAFSHTIVPMNINSHMRLEEVLKAASSSDFLLLMDVNEWMSYKCSDEGPCTQNIHNSSTRSHLSEDENRSKNCKCKRALYMYKKPFLIGTQESSDPKRSLITMGSTDCAQPMIYAQKNNMKIDVFVVYTDCETWFGSVHPNEALKQYRKHSGIYDAKLIVVGMTSNGFTIADPEDPGMFDMAGFDSAAPQVMKEFILGNI